MNTFTVYAAETEGESVVEETTTPATETVEETTPPVTETEETLSAETSADEAATFQIQSVNIDEPVLLDSDNAEIYVGGVGMADGDYLANNAASTTTSKPSGGYAYYKDGVLSLHNYEYSGTGKDDKYIHLRRSGEKNDKFAFFHIELEDEDGSTLYLPGQMVVYCEYKWSDGMEPILIQLLEGISICKSI